MAFSSVVSICARCRQRLMLQSLPVRGQRSFSTSAILSAEVQPTYYEVLGVGKEASPTDIKTAYIQLSKTLHPDMLSDRDKSDQHDLFVQLNEAYGILSKPLTRKDYDLSLLRPRGTEIRVNDIHVTPDDPFGFGGQRAAEWYPRTHIFREGSEEKVHENYYGIKGVRRVNNTYIVYGCMLFIVSGALFHFFVIKQSSQFATQRLDAKDQKIAELYNQAKERARKNGPKKQMELLRERHNDFRLKLKGVVD